jgi:hypothetical protein
MSEAQDTPAQADGTEPEQDEQTNRSGTGLLSDRHTDRDRGFLTAKDRSYLLSSDGSDSATRYRIRKRVKNAVRDFELLDHRMDRVDMRKVVMELFEDDVDAYDYFVSLGVTVYEALDDTTVDMEEFVEDVITRAQNEKYRVGGGDKDGVEVDVDIEIDKPVAEHQVYHKLSDD